MGIYDRDYYREQRPGFTVGGPRTVVTWIILINVAIFLIDGVLKGDRPPNELGPVARVLALQVGDLANPLYWWRFLTYGFAHSSWPNFWHIVGNMVGLFFLGRDIEAHYGRQEFLRLYLTMVVLGGLVWAISNTLFGAHPDQPVVGASGAVVGIVILFALNFPRRILMIWGILPMPAWLLGVLIVAGDVFGATEATLGPALEGDATPDIAYGVHLTGAAFAFCYHRFGWNLGRLTRGWSLPSFRMRPRLRVHDPDRYERVDPDLSDEVDRILQKIHRDGEASLTSKERRFLESASRQYQRKRRQSD